MEPHEYFGQYESTNDEITKDDIKKEVYKEYMETLNSVIDMVSIFPPEWHLQMLKGIMEDI